MTVRQIVFSDDPLLHEASGRVRRIDARVQKLIEDMIETMREADGIGLAAVQIGVLERVVVVEIPIVSEEADEESHKPSETELHVLINPELVHTSDELEKGIEGCLSLPGWVGEVERHRSVAVEGMDHGGRQVRIQAEGLLARVLQHEIDHCQGVLFMDHVDDPEKVWRVEEGQEEAAEAAQEVPSD